MDYLQLINQNPKVSIILIALAITFLITLVNYFFLDKDRMREIKKRQKELQTQMKEHQKAGNTDKLLELQKELFSSTGEMMKHSLKPMLITMIPILVLFGFVRNVYAGTAIASSWFWYYIASAMVGSVIFRKIFNLP
jgi:uncharacterized membrane protein (DUF106 family)